MRFEIKTKKGEVLSRGRSQRQAIDTACYILHLHPAHPWKALKELGYRVVDTWRVSQ